MKKKVLSLIWAVAISMALVPTCFATGWGGVTVTPSAVSEAEDSIKTVLGTIQWIGYVVAIGMLIYVGIRYLTAGAGKKAEAKETLIPMLIGAALVALAPTIANAVFTTIGGGSTSSSGSTSSTGNKKPQLPSNPSNTNGGGPSQVYFQP